MTYKQQLREALAKNGSESRSLLRSMANTAIVGQLTDHDVEYIFGESPLVGKGANQVNPSPTTSGLRDQLSPIALTELAMSALDGTTYDVIREIKHALVSPDSDGVASASTSSKTGYLFGVNKQWIEGEPGLAASDYMTTIKKWAHEELNVFSKGGLTKSLRDITAEQSLMAITHAHRVGLPNSSVDKMAEAINRFLAVHGDKGQAQLEAAYEVWKDGEAEGLPTDVHSLETVMPYATGISDFLGDEDHGTVAAPPAAAEPPCALAMPDDSQAMMIDAVLKACGLPNIKKFVTDINTMTQQIIDLQDKVKASAMPVIAATAEASTSTELPNGKVTTKKAYEVFGFKAKHKADFDFNVPVWEWDAPHPHVVEKDPNYIFRPEELLRFLYALLTDQRAYFWGDTGTGKTTLIEQASAYMYWPFKRVNFDSDISRFDLIGRDTITTDSGVSVSKFEDGILPQMISGPYISCFDEIDAVRPDVSFVMQRALEGNGLMITEDGGRVVKPHKFFRMFATGNTPGQGDEKGIYAGTRPQNLALLDRFTVWCQVDYLSSGDRKKLVKASCPTLEPTALEVVCQYVTEHIKAFKDAKVLQPISPRGMIALGNSVAMFSMMSEDTPTKRKAAIQRAFDTVILDRATSTDRAVFKGICDRVIK